MAKYIIYFNEGTASKKYVYNIYRGSVSDSKDIGDAIEFDSKELSLMLMEYLNKREGTTKYKVMCIKTTIEEVVE